MSAIHNGEVKTVIIGQVTCSHCETAIITAKDVESYEESTMCARCSQEFDYSE